MLTLKGSVMYIALAIGMAFVILTKEIDVSVGSILGISAAIAATMLRNGKNLFFYINYYIVSWCYCRPNKRNRSYKIQNTIYSYDSWY